MRLTREDRQRFSRIRTLADLQELDPVAFELFCGYLYREQGYDVQTTVVTGDGGVDLHLRHFGRNIIAQCKRTTGTVGQAVVRDLYGTMLHNGADAAILLTTGRISQPALDFAIGKPIRLLDGNALLRLHHSLQARQSTDLLGGALEPILAPLRRLYTAVDQWLAGILPPSLGIVNGNPLDSPLLRWLAAAFVLLFSIIALTWAILLTVRPAWFMPDARATPDPAATAVVELTVGVDPTVGIDPTAAAELTAAAPPPTPDTGQGGAPPAATPVPPLLPTGSPLPRMSGVVVLDGVLNEWGGIGTIDANQRLYADRGWDGTDDLQARWRLAWDDAFLYAAVEVVDDVIVPPQVPRLAYRADSVELWLDTDPYDLGDDLFSQDEYIALFFDNGSGNFGTYSYLGWPAAEIGFIDVPTLAIQGFLQRVTGGYIIELALPWRSLNVVPTADMQLGIVLVANDNDRPTLQVQEVQYAQVANAVYNHPASWGRYYLQP